MFIKCIFSWVIAIHLRSAWFKTWHKFLMFRLVWVSDVCWAVSDVGWLIEVIQIRKSYLCDSRVTRLVNACLTLVGHLLYQCHENQARFIQLQGKHSSRVCLVSLNHSWLYVYLYRINHVMVVMIYSVWYVEWVQVWLVLCTQVLSWCWISVVLNVHRISASKLPTYYDCSLLT